MDDDLVTSFWALFTFFICHVYDIQQRQAVFLAALIFMVSLDFFYPALKKSPNSQQPYLNIFPSYPTNSKGISNPIHIYVYKHIYSNDYIILLKSGLNMRIPVATPTHLNLLSTLKNLFSHIFYSISIKSGIYLFAQRCFPINLSIYFVR